MPLHLALIHGAPRRMALQQCVRSRTCHLLSAKPLALGSPCRARRLRQGIAEGWSFAKQGAWVVFQKPTRGRVLNDVLSLRVCLPASQACDGNPPLSLAACLGLSADAERAAAADGSVEALLGAGADPHDR
jgi:hypothetical protein